ncbi:MAG: hypothetical protein OEZ01_05045, partial [Candidatus Heimdallarchaeota archaeon]|nr:hypothetical protein [Candidatus Heimdallarchaeota archaeon]
MSQNDPCIKASNLFKKGDIKGAKTKITTCIKQLEKQIRDFRKDINKQTMVKLRLSQVLWLEGQIHIHLNNINNAKASFIKCRNFVNGFPETNELLEFKGQIDYTLSQIEIHMGNIEEAIKLLINSQDCYNKASKHI